MALERPGHLAPQLRAACWPIILEITSSVTQGAVRAQPAQGDRGRSADGGAGAGHGARRGQAQEPRHGLRGRARAQGARRLLPPLPGLRRRGAPLQCRQGTYGLAIGALHLLSALGNLASFTQSCSIINNAMPDVRSSGLSCACRYYCHWLASSFQLSVVTTHTSTVHEALPLELRLGSPRTRLVPLHFAKFFKILRHIEFLNAYMKH